MDVSSPSDALRSVKRYRLSLAAFSAIFIKQNNGLDDPAIWIGSFLCSKCIEQILRLIIDRAESLGLWMRGNRRLALRQSRRMLVHVTRLYARGESPRLAL